MSEQNITKDFDNLPEKVLKIFNAVEKLAEQGKDVTTLKVSEISSMAGIGKGTTYEYFESREEMISKAVFYSISKSIGMILQIFKEEIGFKENFYKMMDYIWSRRLDENATRSVFEVLRTIQKPENAFFGMKSVNGEKMITESFAAIEKELISYMEKGMKEKLFREENMKFAKNVLCSQVIQFLFFLQDNPMENDKREIEDFVYDGLILMMNR